MHVIDYIVVVFCFTAKISEEIFRTGLAETHVL